VFNGHTFDEGKSAGFYSFTGILPAYGQSQLHKGSILFAADIMQHKHRWTGNNFLRNSRLKLGKTILQFTPAMQNKTKTGKEKALLLNVFNIRHEAPSIVDPSDDQGAPG